MPRYAVIVDSPRADRTHGFVLEADTAEHALRTAARVTIVNDRRGCATSLRNVDERLTLAREPSGSTFLEMVAAYSVAHVVPDEDWAQVPLYSANLLAAPTGWLDAEGRLHDAAGQRISGPRLERPEEPSTPFDDGAAPLRYFADVPTRLYLTPGLGVVMIDPFRLRGA